MIGKRLPRRDLLYGLTLKHKVAEACHALIPDTEDGCVSAFDVLWYIYGEDGPTAFTTGLEDIQKCLDGLADEKRLAHETKNPGYVPRYSFANLNGTYLDLSVNPAKN